MIPREEVSQREKAAGDDPVKLLDLAERVGEKDARILLSKVFILLGPGGRAFPPANENLPTRFAKTLQAVARTPEEVQAVVGKTTAKTVVRQIYYRRYREQWVINQPIRLCVVFDCIKGKDPQVLSVFTSPAEIP